MCSFHFLADIDTKVVKGEGFVLFDVVDLHDLVNVLTLYFE